MIERTLQERLLKLAAAFPVVTLTGPRQSGKTTLCRLAFPDKPYITLESPAERQRAADDPLGFLGAFPDGAIIDEVQRVPELPSYLQGMVDEDPRPGRFILTGSQNFGIWESVTQSLAGRTALLELLPLSLEELRRFEDPPQSLFETVWSGGYPRIFERNLPPSDWLESYVATYVERDVRQLVNVGDLIQFQTFLRLCAGRTGQLLNYSSLAADVGISQPTAKAWLSVLEASYLVFRLPPFHRNLGKRLVKSPKLYFYDTGVACSLLGIETPAQLETHPLRGSIFESWVVAEVAKQILHRGRRPRLSFYRDRGGLEVDLLVEGGGELTAVEIKSGQTPTSGFFTGLDRFADIVEPMSQTRLGRRIAVYGGAEPQTRSGGLLLPWSQLDLAPWAGPPAA